MSQSCPQCAAPLPEDSPEGTLCPDCDAQAAEAAPPTLRIAAAGETVLETIGDFAVLSKLGQGGMGAVYRARQVSLGRLVALKVLPAQFADDADYVSRFQREAKVAASLTHPNLVRIYSAGDIDGSRFIAMELIEGEDLHKRLRREGPLPPVEALRICLGIARGLQYGWERAQLIHRDIKPSNVYLAANGDVKLGDLGLAKSVGGQSTGLTQSGMMMGTPHYISPEQARADKSLDFRADIYSLGCTLFECLTGRPPYEADDPFTLTNLHVNAPPPALLKVLPGAPLPLARLVSRMLKKGKHERHASYDELIAEIERVMDLLVHGDSSAGKVAAAWKGVTTESSIVGSKANTPRPATAIAAPTDKSKLPVYVAIAGVILVLGLGTWWILPGKKPAPAAPVARRAAAAEREPSTAAVSTAAPHVPRATAGWQPLLAEASWKKSQPPGWEFVDGLLHLSKRAADAPQPTADGAIRARVRLRGLDGYPEVHLRSSKAGKYLAVLNKANGVELIFYPTGGGQHRGLGRHTLPQPVRIGDSFTLELRAQAAKLTVLFNDVVVIEAEDTTLAEPGNWGLYSSGDAWFESAEVQPASSPAGSPASPSNTPLTYGGHRFQLVEKKISWPEAKTSAEAAGGHLANAEDRAKLDWLIAHVPLKPNSSYWLGGYREDGSTEWRWQNGTPIDHSLWLPAQPDVKNAAAAAKLNTINGRTGLDDSQSNGTVSGYVVEWDTDADEKWQDLLSDPAKLRLTPPVDPTQSFLLGEQSAAWASASTSRQRDGAVRIRSIFGGANASIRLRASTAGYYRLSTSASAISLLRTEGDGQAETVSKFQLKTPLHSGQEYELELRVVGHEFTAKLDGEILFTATDTKLEQGTFGLGAADHGAPAVVKSFAFLDLDPPSAARTTIPLPIAATPPGSAIQSGDAALLFDGKSFSGWHGLGQRNPPASWQIADGAMVGGGRTLLVTDQEYEDFDLSLQWRVGPQGNGGIFYLVPAAENGGAFVTTWPEFNLMDDSLDWRNRSGSLFGVQETSSTSAAKPVGSWNTARLVKRGGKVEHWINDQLVCSYDLNDPATRERWKGTSIGGKPGFASGSRGRIALQGWNGEVAYRNIRLR